MTSAFFLLANTTTWMMFVNLPMLLVGNVLIGLLEGVILTWVFKVRWHRAVAFMIVANYVSMLAGLALFGFAGIEGLFHIVWRPTVGDYREWFWFVLGLAFVLSILLEWPLCRLSFTPNARSWKRSLLACSVLQVVSYLLCLAPILHWYEDIHINDTVKIVPVMSVVDGDLPFRVYFIDPDDGDIYRMKINGTEIEHVLHTKLDPGSRLLLYSQKTSIESGVPFGLFVSNKGEKSVALLQKDFALSESAFLNPFEIIEGLSAWSTYAFAADLRPEHERSLFVRVNWDGLQVAEEWTSGDGEYHGLGYWIFTYSPSFDLQFKTTIGSWPCLNPTILPGDIVIFEFGGQICALDLKQRKLALIRMGYGPVVVRDEDESSD